MAPGNSVAIVIIDPDVGSRRRLVQVLAQRPDIRILGLFGGLGDALQGIAQHGHEAKVVLVDTDLPDGNGTELIQYLASDHPQCCPLVRSANEELSTILRSLRAGALGYLHKSAEPDEVADAIHAVSAGGSPLSPAIARRLVQHLTAPPGSAAGPAAASAAGLQDADRDRVGASAPPGPDHGSRRGDGRAGSKDRPRAASGEAGVQRGDRVRPGERLPLPVAPAAHVVLDADEAGILRLMARGFSNREIAILLKQEVSSVDSQVKSLYRKLEVQNRRAAVEAARQSGLALSPDRGMASVDRNPS